MARKEAKAKGEGRKKENAPPANQGRESGRQDSSGVEAARKGKAGNGNLAPFSYCASSPQTARMASTMAAAPVDAPPVAPLVVPNPKFGS